MRKFKIKSRSVLGLLLSGSGLLLVLTVPSVSKADQVTLYAYASPRPLRWENPRSLLMSAVENELLAWGSKYAHSIGHVNVDLQCDATAENAAVRDFAGMTAGKGYNPGSLILRGYGLGVLLQSFPGTLETQDRVRHEINHGQKTGHMNFVKFLISSKTCHRLHQYFVEFQERGNFKSYGLVNRPRYGEGAGCSAFGVSFLELGGLLSRDLTQDWSKNIEISDALIGGPGTGRKISIRQILFDRSSWNPSAKKGTDSGPRHLANVPSEVEESPKTKEISFWEPNAIYQWVKNAWKEAPPPGFEKMNAGKALGLVTDATRIPTPIDPIWKK